MVSSGRLGSLASTAAGAEQPVNEANPAIITAAATFTVHVFIKILIT
ncbi:hypothetical protein [Arthrobacter luteolus]